MYIKFLITFTALQIAAANPSPVVDHKIVGGHEAAITDFPYQISLRRNGNHICGGSLISEHYVLTAAHCIVPFQNKIHILSVMMGSSRLSEGKIIHQINDTFVHPKYNGNIFPVANDLAIIQLKEPAQIDNEKIKLVPLETVSPKEGTMCTVTGWGLIREGAGRVQDHLMAVDIPIYNDTVCSAQKGDIEGVICAGLLEGGKDSCQGDSGGPLVCDGRLAGIVSCGEGCARPRCPGFYTEVAFYTQWLEPYHPRHHNFASSTVVTMPTLLLPFLLAIFYQSA